MKADLGGPVEERSTRLVVSRHSAAILGALNGTVGRARAWDFVLISPLPQEVSKRKTADTD